MGVDLRQRERAENFPIALRVLPRAPRTHLQALYGVARTIDYLGDEAPGDRIAQLDAFEAQLAGIWRGEPPDDEVLARLVPTVHECALELEPFRRLIEANRQDQRVAWYPTYADLRAYCVLSADPVGRLVLQIFHVYTPERAELSDRICTALQLAEHWQDVAEDRRAGRVYLPREDLERFGVAPTDLDAPHAGEPLRELMAFQVERARALLDSGTPLVHQLTGWARLAVAGYVAGGRAALAAIRRAGGDVLAGTPRPRRRDVARHLSLVLAKRGG